MLRVISVTIATLTKPVNPNFTAHAVGDKIEAAYRRGDLIEKRRHLMAEWASYCNRPAASGRDKVMWTRGPR